jgi:hypothetical protein
MAWWDSSAPGWVGTLVPNYEQASLEFRLQLNTAMEILSDHPGYELMVSERLIQTVGYLRKIKMLAADIRAYFPDYPPFACNQPEHYEFTFPRICNCIARNLYQLSEALRSTDEEARPIIDQLQCVLVLHSRL